MHFLIFFAKDEEVKFPQGSSLCNVLKNNVSHLQKSFFLLLEMGNFGEIWAKCFHFWENGF